MFREVHRWYLRLVSLAAWISLVSITCLDLKCSLAGAEPSLLEEQSPGENVRKSSLDEFSLSDAIAEPERAQDQAQTPAIDLPLERLPGERVEVPYLQEPVTSVARQPSTVGRSAAAIFVIDQEMIRRSGARSIPEALRMVPGLYVARVNANRWSVSSRGFSSQFARKLLVQIDGRTVYSPLSSGTFWDVQDLLLEDIERIEVIRGPGATVWGVNAVNGVINIITKNAKDTHGVYANAGGGTEERSFAGGRVGGVTPEGIHWRVYGKGFERDRQFEPNGLEFDDWRQARTGFRADWQPNECDSFTFQGDYYQGENGLAAFQPLSPIRPFLRLNVDDEPVQGGDLLGRWTRTLGEQSETALQLYYDRTDRNSLGFDQKINTIDLDFQHRFPLSDRHKLIYGLGYRAVWDELTNTTSPVIIGASPESRTVEIVSGFVQDEIMLIEDSLYFTLGTKLSNNTFSDFDVQPSARLLWLPDQRSAAWAAVSRAVRIPSRIEHDGRIVLVLPRPAPQVPFTLLGSHDLDSEQTMAYEIGYRRQPVDWFSWDLALFYNVDDDFVNFRSISPVAPTLQFFNAGHFEAYGFELAGQVDMNECWKVSGGYSFMRLIGQVDQTAIRPAAEFEDGNPTHQVFLMSSWDLSKDVEFDLIARYLDNVPSVDVPHYISLDARVAWRPNCNTEIAIVGQNLLDSHHPEYGSSLFTGEIATEAQRGVYMMVSWSF